jgi:outer membrane protein
LEDQKKKLSQSSGFLEQVYDEIRFIAESEGYSMVLNLKENTGILWYSPTVDITDKLIQNLRTKAGR